MSLFQNSGTDFFGRKAGALDIDKKIDAALWRIKDTHIRSFLNLLSGKEHALTKYFTDFRFQFFTVLQSKDGSALRDRRSGKHYIFVDLLHDLDDFFRSDQVADPPAGHRKILRKRVDDDRSLPHAVYTQERTERLLIAESGVNVIRDHKQVVFDNDFRNSLQGIHAETHTGRSENLLLRRLAVLLEHRVPV